MFNVLNEEWEKIVVETINPKIHRHVSGREFTEDDACVKIIPKSPYADISMEEATHSTGVYVVDMEEMWFTREQAIEAYTQKYGRKPHPSTKTENIIAKL